ncbi:MAG: leucine-rich repeat domain-containing protein, partial [Kiritimatiellae bacterium]|nr:leucine-rich repeat domain-containing protein [Kiritimatiellia bacterium]
MNRLTKFIRSLAALLVGAAMFAPLGAWADTWTDESGNVWTYSGSKVTAVSFETTNLTIPDTLGGNPVTAFDAAVFKGKTRAVRVTIPATVTAIPASAFEGCVNLKAVTIQGEGLTSIGYRAFAGCDNLEEFVMPNSVTSLGQGAFSGCSAMESVTLSDSLVELSGVAYRGAGTYVSGNGYGDSADSASLSTTDVTDGLFYNCTSLKTINWGTGIKAIGNVAFLNCSALEKVEIPDTVTEIGYHA